MLKLLVSALIAMTLALGPLGAEAAQLKIGIVDSNAILTGSPEGKAAQAAIKRKAEELSRPLGTKRDDISRQVQDFQKQAGMMKDAARKAKQQELEKKMADFDKQAQDADKQLSLYRQNQLAPLTKKLDNALERVSQDEHLDLILDKSVVLINNKALDVTDKVRAAFGR